MANKILNLIFKATDKASPVIDDITGAAGDKGIGGITSALSGLIGPATLASAAVFTVGKAVADMMVDWQGKVLGIRDLASNLGIAMEQASGLAAVAEQYGVPMGAMETAMISMAEYGLEPTVAGLGEAKRLLDEAGGPTERMALATEMWGSAGAKLLVPMLSDLTTTELTNYVDLMPDVIKYTEDEAVAAQENAEAVAAMAGSWEGLKMAAAGWAAPGLTALIELFLRPISADSVGVFLKDFIGAGASTPWSGSFYVEQGGTSGSGSGGDFTRRENLPATSGGSSPSVHSGTSVGLGEFQHGGEFTIGGHGGPDSQLVQFMGSPGERVEVGGGGEMAALLEEVAASDNDDAYNRP